MEILVMWILIIAILVTLDKKGIDSNENNRNRKHMYIYCK